MANPNKARGAKSRANLKPGGNHQKTPAERAQMREVAKIAKKLLDPAYIKKLKERLRTGKIQPGVEVAIWQYAYGKPTEVIETKQVVPIRISHQYTE